MQVADRTLLEAMTREPESHESNESETTVGLTAPPPITFGRGRRQVRSGLGPELEWSPQSSIIVNQKTCLSAQEQHMATIIAKHEKLEEKRERDRRAVLERVEFNKEQREDRFKRLLDEVMGRDSLTSLLAWEIRRREAHQEKRQKELHAAWEEKVFNPLQTQAHEKLNPQDRALLQRLAGTKSVSFEMPGDVFRLRASPHEDPVRKVLVETAKENAFHQAASAVLGQSHSAPDLRSLQSAPGQKPTLIPKPVSRPVLEPVEWGQVAIKGTIHGHTAQVTRNGTGLRRTVKGGKDAHLPDESDGVVPAGTRKGPNGAINDKGILKGDAASRGSASEHKNPFGSSCAAPGQDHYMFEIGSHVTNMEYPHGKRLFPECHSTLQL